MIFLNNSFTPEPVFPEVSIISSNSHPTINANSSLISSILASGESTFESAGIIFNPADCAISRVVIV